MKCLTDTGSTCNIMLFDILQNIVKNLILQKTESQLKLKHNHYYIKTLDDILPHFAKVKVFSVLDTKDGYHQIEIENKSSY